MRLLHWRNVLLIFHKIVIRLKSSKSFFGPCLYGIKLSGKRKLSHIVLGDLMTQKAFRSYFFGPHQMKE